MVSVKDFETAWANKADRGPAMEIAQRYCEQERAVLEPIIGDKTSDELVQLIGLLRQAGNHEMAQAVTMWELCNFERRQIGGAVNTTPVNAPRRLR